jgi:hypothetical protein
MSDFIDNFEKALRAFGYPMGSLAYDLATAPLPAGVSFDQMLADLVYEQEPEEE